MARMHELRVELERAGREAAAHKAPAAISEYIDNATRGLAPGERSYLPAVVDERGAMLRAETALMIWKTWLDRSP